MKKQPLRSQSIRGHSSGGQFVPQQPVGHGSHQTPVSLATRRGILKVSMAAALGSLLGARRSGRAADKEAPGKTALGANATVDRKFGRAKSVILLWLEGGPSQIDTFDPKEAMDSSLGLIYPPRSTASSELAFAEGLPELSRQAGEMTVIRSMLGAELEHTLAQYHVQTGWRNTGIIEPPSMGALVSHEIGAMEVNGLPGSVSIDHAGFTPGYFGADYAPTIVWDPTKRPENLALPDGVTPAVLARRLKLLDTVQAGGPLDASALDLASGRQGALRFMNSKFRAAFDLERESERSRDAYGRTRFGQGCLLARRLVEAGVSFIQVKLANFDTHKDHYKLHDACVAKLDRGMARLIVDLKARGLLGSTVVIAAGEFGRTPRMNKDAGRDHWIKGYSVALAGGGFKRGFGYGRTMKKAQDIAQDPVTIPDFMATLCHTLGIDPEREYHDSFDRPIKLVDDGYVIRDLLA